MTRRCRVSEFPKFCKHRKVRRDTDGVYVGPGCAKGYNVRNLVGGSDFGWALRCPCILTERSKDVARCLDADMESGEEHFAEPLALVKLRDIWLDGPDSEAARAARGEYRLTTEQNRAVHKALLASVEEDDFV